MVPILAQIVAVLPGAINTVVSVIKDKKKKKEAEGTEMVHEEIAKGVSVSGKRLMSIGGAGILIPTGLAMVESNPKVGIILIVLGVGFGIGMEAIKAYSDKSE
ncbi:MAG: hypothetical protein ACQ9ET_00055 [Nitrosomonadaceae bacterium]